MRAQILILVLTGSLLACGAATGPANTPAIITQPATLPDTPADTTPMIIPVVDPSSAPRSDPISTPSSTASSTPSSTPSADPSPSPSASASAAPLQFACANNSGLVTCTGGNLGTSTMTLNYPRIFGVGVYGPANLQVVSINVQNSVNAISNAICLTPTQYPNCYAGSSCVTVTIHNTSNNSMFNEMACGDAMNTLDNMFEDQ